MLNLPKKSLLLVATVSLLVGGCPATDAPNAANVFQGPWPILLGSDGARLIYSISAFPDSGENVFVLDLTTLESSLLTATVSPISSEDTRFLASVDWDGDAISVSEIDTGSEEKFLVGRTNQQFAQPVFVDAQRVIVTASDPETVSGHLIVINRLTEQQSGYELPRAVGPDAVAVQDNWLAVISTVLPDLPDVEPLEVLGPYGTVEGAVARSQLELINLANEDRAVLSTGFVAAESGVFFSGDSLVWVETNEHFNQYTLRSYDLTLRQLRDLRTSSGSEELHLVHATDDRLLLRRVTLAGFQLRDEFQVQSLSGAVKSIHSMTRPLAASPLPGTSPILVDRTVVLVDPATGEILVIDTDSGEQRRAMPG